MRKINLRYRIVILRTIISRYCIVIMRTIIPRYCKVILWTIIPRYCIVIMRKIIPWCCIVYNINPRQTIILLHFKVQSIKEDIYPLVLYSEQYQDGKISLVTIQYTLSRRTLIHWYCTVNSIKAEKYPLVLYIVKSQGVQLSLYCTSIQYQGGQLLVLYSVQYEVGQFSFGTVQYQGE